MNSSNSQKISFQETIYRRSEPLPLISNKFSPLTPITGESEGFSSIIEHLPKIQRSNSLKSRKTNQVRTNTPNFSQIPSPTVLLNNYGIVQGFGAVSTAGLKKGKNEDKVQIVLNIKKPENYNEKWPKSSFFAVFDGEGGLRCSQFLKDNLHEMLFKDKNFPIYPKKAFVSAFAKADAEFLKIADENCDFSASSAIVSLFLGKWCFLAGLGDSLAFLSIDEGNRIIGLNQTHTVMNESEKKRILKAGGSLFKTYSMSNNVRQEHGVYKVRPGNLDTTRSFGNLHSKAVQLGGNPKVCLNIPEITYFKIQDNFDFLLLISSGLAKWISPGKLIKNLIEDIEHFQGNLEQRLSKSIESLIHSAILDNLQENLSVVLIIFSNFKTKFNY